MIYAPIYIITLNRNEHLRCCLESLKQNTWALYTDVYIGVDYPPSEKYEFGFKKVCEYLTNEDFSVFKSFNIIKREKNLGALENSRDICELLMKKYDRWIYVEDDIVFSKNFLEYMDKCLERYENDNSVLAINGYKYDVPYIVDGYATVFRQSYVCSEWGIGYWKNKYIKMQNDLRKGIIYNSFETYHNKIRKKMLKNRYDDYYQYCLTGNNPLFVQTCDISMGIYMALKNKCTITPVISKTRTLGFDGSGIYCQKIQHFDNKTSLTYDYSKQIIDSSLSFELKESNISNDIENKEIIDKFLVTSDSQKRRIKILHLIYMCLGRKTCVKIHSLLKKVKHQLKRINK